MHSPLASLVAWASTAYNRPRCASGPWSTGAVSSRESDEAVHHHLAERKGAVDRTDAALAKLTEAPELPAQEPMCRDATGEGTRGGARGKPLRLFYTCRARRRKSSRRDATKQEVRLH